MTLELVVAILAFAIWVYLLLFRGGFWLGRDSDARDPPSMQSEEPWPRVVAIVPARNEADMLPQSLRSLLTQDYARPVTVILVDDQSEDDTSDVARSVAVAAGREVVVLRGQPLPPGWTGKVWAMQQGIVHAAAALPDPPEYLLLTDADIGYSRDALTHLVARARGGGFALTSFMAKLNCKSFAERALIPAFVFFFQMLYPFTWVGRASRHTAAAAGGCMLVERRALEKAGGMSAIRDALIDDCALAAELKAEGPIWLGLTERVTSLRAYPRIGDICHMVSRSAYAQLRYSPLLLAGTIIGMAVTYIAAPLLAIFGSYPSYVFGVAAWCLMAIAFQPTLRLYRSSPLWGPLLPLIAAAYLVFTVDSAYQHWRGRGGMWKGRAQSLPERR